MGENEAKLTKKSKEKSRLKKQTTVEIDRRLVQEKELHGWVIITRKRKASKILEHYYLTPEKKYKFRSNIQAKRFAAALKELGDEDKAWETKTWDAKKLTNAID